MPYFTILFLNGKFYVWHSVTRIQNVKQLQGMQWKQPQPKECVLSAGRVGKRKYAADVESTSQVGETSALTSTPASASASCPASDLVAACGWIAWGSAAGGVHIVHAAAGW